MMRGKKKRAAGPKRRMPMRRRGVGKARVARKSDYARVVEAWEGPIQTDVSGNFGYSWNTSLSEFQRAQEVAHAYKYYRAAKV